MLLLSMCGPSAPSYSLTVVRDVVSLDMARTQCARYGLRFGRASPLYSEKNRSSVRRSLGAVMPLIPCHIGKVFGPSPKTFYRERPLRCVADCFVSSIMCLAVTCATCAYVFSLILILIYSLFRCCSFLYVGTGHGHGPVGPDAV